MNSTRDLLFALSWMVVLPACTAPIESNPGPQPSPTSTVSTPPAGPPGVTASWKAAPDSIFADLVAATAGDEGAILVAESEHKSDTPWPPPTRLRLQRLDATGATRGEPVELGALGAGVLSGLTLASDGSRYIACWGDEAQTACATVPVEEGGASPGLVVKGTAPVLAYGAGKWALAYATSDKLAVVALTGEGGVSGTPTLFDAGPGPNGKRTSLLAANDQGFILVGGSGTDASVHQLDHTLAPLGAPLPLGADFWFFAAMATSGTKTAINLAKPYGSTTFFLDGAALLDSQDYPGGGKVGLRVALAAEGSSFGMLSGGDSDPPADGPRGLLYRRIAPGVKATVAAVLPEDERSYDDSPIALLRLGGDTFVAATQAYYTGTEIVIARAPRP